MDKSIFKWNQAAIYNQLWRILQFGATSLRVVWFKRSLLEGKKKAFWTTELPYNYSRMARERQVLSIELASLRTPPYIIGCSVAPHLAIFLPLSLRFLSHPVSDLFSKLECECIRLDSRMRLNSYRPFQRLS